MFRHLDQLKVGDEFYFHNIETSLTYEVDQIIVVEPWDYEPILVAEDEDLMTLLTCTPYMVNSHRLLVRGHRIDYNTDHATTDSPGLGFDYRSTLRVVIVVLVILIILAIKTYRDYKNIKKEADKLDEK